jgi:glycosyltransferase involved in cell wall biosynthesis
LHLIDEELPREPSAREQACRELNERIRDLIAVLGPFDAVYERHALWSCAAVEFARGEGIPGILEVNARLVEEQANHRSLVDHAGANEVTRRAFHAASAVLCVSEGVADYVRSFGAGYQRIHVIPNAVNQRTFIPRQRRANGSNRNEFTIGFVGSLKPWHGVDRLIAAYEQLWNHGPNWRLKIVGDGPDRTRLESLVRALPARVASSIEFVGIIPHADIPAALTTLDAAVAPGVTGEEYFSPLKVFEYMAAGLPIVAARLGQLATIIEHGETGLLYNPDDSMELAGAVLRLRDDREAAARMGDAARHAVAAHHTWDHRRDAILRIIKDCNCVSAQIKT